MSLTSGDPLAVIKPTVSVTGKLTNSVNLQKNSYTMASLSALCYHNHFDRS